MSKKRTPRKDDLIAKVRKALNSTTDKVIEFKEGTTADVYLYEELTPTILIDLRLSSNGNVLITSLPLEKENDPYAMSDCDNLKEFDIDEVRTIMQLAGIAY